MPRAIWTGSISFGLVNVPVKLYSAVHQQDIHFNQFEEGTGAHIQYKRVSEKSGDEVPWEHIVKGYEVSKGNFVMVEPDELDAIRPGGEPHDRHRGLRRPRRHRPHLLRAHLLPRAPAPKGRRQGLRLLLEAMEDQGKVGIGRVVLRTKQYLAAIRPLEGALRCRPCSSPTRLSPPSSIDGLPDGKHRRPADARGRHGRADHRVAHHRLGPVALPRHVP